jgi:hypothetical protein
MRINRIIERASGHRRKGRRHVDGGDPALEFHGLANFALGSITNKASRHGSPMSRKAHSTSLRTCGRRSKRC